MTTATTKDKYIEAVGRRKTATARVRLTAGTKTSFIVNDKLLEDYFGVADYRAVAKEAFDKNPIDKKFSVIAQVSGGGISAQAEAIRHGITRALVKYDAELRSPLKKLGLLKRDPRSRERRKAGLAQAARKRKQWSKR